MPSSFTKKKTLSSLARSYLYRVTTEDGAADIRGNPFLEDANFSEE